jgi:SsrA-binding protein
MKKPKEVDINNRKALFEFELLDKFTAGIMLKGTEIKSVRDGKVNLKDAFCFFKAGELYVKNMHIAEYSHGNLNNHEPLSVRKLLLTQRELGRLQLKVKEKGLTIIVARMFVNERGYAKIEIHLAKGKKSFDKRNSIKAKDQKRDLDRTYRIK